MAKLHVLGSGGPIPAIDRFGTAHVVEVGGLRIMFDCGPAATYKMSKVGLNPEDIDYLFFTHHHYDHDVDYPTLLLSRWNHSIGKEPPLNVFGPTHTEEITERLVGENGAFAFDIAARIGHPLSQRMHLRRGGTLPRWRPKVNARDIGPGTVHTADKFEVTAAPAEHVQPFLDSLAYRLDTREGSIVFTGDTQPCERVVDLARGADTLVSMCGNLQSSLEERDVADGQTGTLGAAEMAAEARVKQLFLVHVGPNISTGAGRQKALAEIRQVYGGEVTMTDELSAYDITPWRPDEARPDTAGYGHPHIHRH